MTPPRKVHLYQKADFEWLKGELRRVKEEFISMEPTSTTQELWVKFCSTVSDLMNKNIPSKMLKGNKVKKPWINRTVRSLIRRRNKLFRKMKKKKKKKKKESDIQNYKDSKSAVQKAERQSYWSYINNIIETDDAEKDHPPKQKRFWNYIK